MARNYPKKVKNKVVKNIEHPNLKFFFGKQVILREIFCLEYNIGVIDIINIWLLDIIGGSFLIIKCYIIIGGIILDLKTLLDIKAKGEVFIYIKLFLMVKKYLGVLFFRPIKGGISIFKYNNK